MNLNFFASFRVSSVALLVAACGSDGAQGTGIPNLGSDSGAGGGDVGTGGKNAGGSASGSGGAAGGGSPSSGGSAGSGTGASGGLVGAGGSAGGSADSGLAGSGGVAADGGMAGSGGVAADGGTAGSGGVVADGGGLTDAGPVAPPPAGIVAYGYAGDAASTTAYELQQIYRFHQNGGTVTSRRTTSVGTYAIDLTGLTVPVQNVQVTAYDQAAYCTVAAFGTDKATVRCYDFTGTTVNARFSFVALGPAATAGGASFTAYTWTEKETDTDYAPNAMFTYSISAAAVTAHRTAPGTYSLDFSGLSLASGNVQVTSYSSMKHCNVKSWANSTVAVRCYDAAGALADARYQVLLAQNSDADPKIQGYATTAGTANPGGDLSAGGYAYNATGGRTIANYAGTGHYTVRFEGTDLRNVKVSAAYSNKYCSVAVVGGDMISVDCVDPDGNPADSRFSVVAL